MRDPDDTAATNIVPRKQLLRELVSGGGKKVTVITAPGGFGKSTLAAGWYGLLRARGQIVAWLDLDKDANDEAKFYQSLITSLISAGCPISQGVIALHRKNNRANDTKILQEIADELKSLSERVHLFIDDFHFLDRDRVLKGVSEFMSLSPDNLHIVLMSRQMPGLPLSSLELHEQLTIIDANDLRFTPPEIRLFIEKRTGRKLSWEQINNIYKATEGWAAAIQMVSISLSTAHDFEHWEIPDEGDDARGIIHRLANDTFERLPEEIRIFLKKISILEKFCPELCNYVTGQDNAAAIIEDLIRSNYFIIPLSAEKEWYRFHHLYSEFLRSKIVEDVKIASRGISDWMQQWTSQERSSYGAEFLAELSTRTRNLLNVHELHKRSGQWLADHGYTADAVNHMIMGGEREIAVHLLERCAYDLVAAGRMEYLLFCLERLPREAVDGSATLLEAKGFAHFLTCNVEGSREELKKLDTAGEEQDDERIFARETLRSGIGLYCDDAAATLTVADFWPPVGNAFVKGAACNIVMFGRICQGSLAEAKMLASYARTEESMRESYFPKVYRGCFSGLVAQNEGHLHEAERLYRESLRTAERGSGRRSAPACVAAAYLSGLLYECGDFTESEELLVGRYDLLEDLLLPDGFLRATIANARIKIRQEDYVAAAELVQRLERCAARGGMTRILAAVLEEKIRMMLLIGSSTEGTLQAFSDLKGCVEVAETHCVKEVTSRFHASLVRLNLFGLVSQARNRQVDECKAAYKRAVSVKTRIDTALIVAQLMAAVGDSEGVSQWARKALRLAGNHGFSTALEDHLHEMDRALDNQVFARYVSSAGAEEYAERLWAKEVDSGEQEFDEMLAGDAARVQLDSLTAREIEILRLLSRGGTNKDIANRLFIAENTVKYHLKQIFQKLHVQTRHKAVRRAEALRLLAPPEII